MRLLIVGAGATIAEAEMMRSGLSESLPTMANFCNKLFQNQPVVQRTLALYLTDKGISYNPTFIDFLNGNLGETISREKITSTPLDVFLKLEREEPENHNVETFFEYAWNHFGETHPDIWDVLIYWTIYLGLFPPFTTIFHKNGVGYKKMIAGAIICNELTNEDIVLNLNYDVCFDIAIKQCFGNYCYAPNKQEGAVEIFKPHGSLNLFVNRGKNRFMFCDPEEIPGTVTYPDPEGGYWKGRYGIVPPRLNKKYSQHPLAKTILNNIKSYKPDVVTFWGVGLTNSDIDLLEIYKNACHSAETIEFINPSIDALNKAKRLLESDLKHYENINYWKDVK
jgi:hypothetical protein